MAVLPDVPPATLGPVPLSAYAADPPAAQRWDASPAWPGLTASGDGTSAGPEAPGALIAGGRLDDVVAAKIGPGRVLVSTTALLAPMVDSPGDFGAIVASHACSAVLAAGADVVVASPAGTLPKGLERATVEEIQSSAAEVVAAAGGVLAGGDAVSGHALVFGLSVQGVLRGEHLMGHAGASVGDVLVLSKPLGTGVLLTGGSDEQRERTVASMRELNLLAARRLSGLGGSCHAVTTVSSRGLAGHAHNIAERSGTCLVIDSTMVPCYRGAKQLASSGVVAPGTVLNRNMLEPFVAVDPGSGPAMEALAFDPQTSGGLLAAVDADDVADLVEAGFRPIGTVREVGTDDQGYAVEAMVQIC